MITVEAAGRRPRTPQPLRRRFDLSLVVMIFVGLLMLVPSSRVVEVMGAAGTPANIFAIGMLGLWGALKLSGSPLIGRAGPIHVAMLLFLIAAVASYVSATSTALSEPELNAADRGLLSFAAWAGIVLLTADGVQRRQRLEALLRCLAGFIVFDAAVALAQYLLRVDPLSYITIPGLVVNYDWGVALRSGLIRVVGTGLHSIEFATVQAMGLALVLHWAMHSRTRRARLLWWIGAGLVVAALPLTIARSAMIGLVVVLITLLPVWPKHVRRRAYVVMPLAAVAIRVLFPGVLGTILSLFTYFNEDPSTSGRTTDYGFIFTVLQHNPIIGRGLGTFMPQLYFVLDNQYLLTLVEVGIFGLLALLALLATTIGVIVGARRRLSDPSDRSLAQSLLAGILVACVSWLLFDAFSFPQAAGLLFLLIGSAAALSAQEKASHDALSRLQTTSRSVRYKAAGAAVATGVVVMTALAPSVGTAGEYATERAYLFHTAGLYNQPTELGQFASLVVNWLDTGQAATLVREQGGQGSFVAAQGDGSQERPTEQWGHGPLLWVRVVADTSEQARATQAAVANVVATRVSELQSQLGSDPENLVVATPIAPPSEAIWQHGARNRALAASAVLAALCALLAWIVAVVWFTRVRHSIGAQAVEPEGGR